ncbi:MAG TPA: ABC transporter permease, partial [Vicinamibacterales bacterium]|nr:ABC transporter permease [Vicinamibacterales bacterium]
MTRPPRLAAWLIARSVPREERPFVLGDFDEQFQDRAADDAAGARRWYWRESLRLACGLAWLTPRPRWTRAGVAFMDDVRYAIRRLRHRPLAAAASVLTLALAIGAAASTWTLISAVLLNPLAVPAADRLVEIGWRDPDQRRTVALQTQVGHTYPHFATLRDTGSLPIAAWGAIGSRTPPVLQDNGRVQPASLRFASHNFLELLGLQPSLGRFFTADEDRRGGPLVAVLADRFWRRAFDADPSVLGRTVLVQDRPVQIVGVAPRGFRGLALDSGPDVYLPLHAIEQIQAYDQLFDDGPPLYWVHLVGRMPDGVSLPAMQERLAGVRLGPKQNRRVVLTDLQTAAVPELARVGVKQFTRLLAATVGLLLAVGGLTVGMLLALRTEARAAEFAMCLALGASRYRLAMGVAVEGCVLAFAGALLALPASQMMFAGVRLFQLPGNIRLELLELSLDGRVLAGVAGASIVSVLLIAVVAALFSVRRRAGDALRSPAAATSRVTRRGSRTALVTAQVAVTLVLVTGTVLFARSVAHALALNPGMDIGRIFGGDVDFEGYGYDATRADLAMDALADRLRRTPEIASFGISSYPTQIVNGRDVLVDGESVRLPGYLGLTGADASYFETLSLRILDGRGFLDGDDAGAAPVALVSESL